MSDRAPCRVLVADDHTLVREGIVALLADEPDIEVVGEAADGQQAIELALGLKPDVVIMDIGLPKQNGIEATRRIRQQLPAVQVLALTVYETDEYLEEMLRAGAAGYVLKRAAAHELVDAVRRLRAGQVAIDPDMASSYVLRRSLTAASTPATARVTPLSADQTAPPSPTEQKKAVSAADLSQREREVLRLIVTGHTNRQTAQLLGISEKTVQTHRANIMNKLGVHHTTELVYEALRLGITPPPSTSP